MSPATVHQVLKQEHPDAPWDKKRRQKLHTFGQAGLAFCLDHAELAVGQAKAQVCILLDETSRFILGFSLEFSKSTAKAKEPLRAAMEQYGRPLLVKTDNAPEFREEFRLAMGAPWACSISTPPTTTRPLTARWKG